jgi:hypothetical protein
MKALAISFYTLAAAASLSPSEPVAGAVTVDGAGMALFIPTTGQVAEDSPSAIPTVSAAPTFFPTLVPMPLPTSSPMPTIVPLPTLTALPTTSSPTVLVTVLPTTTLFRMQHIQWPEVTTLLW